MEVWVQGREGDTLWRLTSFNRTSRTAMRKAIVGVAVLRRSGGSFRLPATQRTAQGDCDIVTCHLMANGRQTDEISAGAE